MGVLVKKFVVNEASGDEAKAPPQTAVIAFVRALKGARAKRAAVVVA